MTSQANMVAVPGAIDLRAKELYEAQRDRIVCSTDRMFALLMILQWIGGIIAAVFVSPRTWAGSIPSVHIHVWSAIICGGLISGLPIYLALWHTGKPVTRYTIAVAQMLWSALLIHLTGGRIETHFHVFGSLAFIAIYRDWRVLIPATIVVALDHAIRGVFWPQSVYGVLSATPWRTVEHTAWVVFEVIVLNRACRQSTAEMWQIGEQRAELEQTNERIEQEVQERTEALRESLAWKAVILDSAADGIITFDASGRIKEGNRAAQRMFGYERDALIGLHVSKLMPVSDAKQGPEANIRSIVGARREVMGIRRDGTRIPIDLSVSAVEHGSEQSFTGIMRDLTEQKAAQAELARINDDLQTASRRAGMAEVATGVLHNVGNVLNSVNVSASMATDRIRDSRVTGLSQAVALLDEHADDLGRYLSEDEKGRRLPSYLGMLARHLSDEQDEVLSELESLAENIDHIKNIVSMQQSYATAAGVIETASINDVLEDALRITSTSLARHDIRIDKHYGDIESIATDKQRVIQILVNLIRNAKQAMTDQNGEPAVLTLRTEQVNEVIRIRVSDSGVGIPAENLPRLFRHGFTTKEDGHGFGLHHSALAAKELGGALSAESDGVGKGATFTLELPQRTTGGEE